VVCERIHKYSFNFQNICTNVWIIYRNSTCQVCQVCL